MRPYLAIIKDSFREAMASWVLYILLLLITVVLLALAPLGYQQVLTTKFAWSDIVQGPVLVERIRREADKTPASPGQRMWSLWTAGRQRQLEEFANQAGDGPGPGYMAGMAQLVDALNELVERPDFYESTAWDQTRLSRETRELLESKSNEKLTAAELQRLNRLLIEDAFSDAFRTRPRESIIIKYAFLDATNPLATTKQQMESIVQQIALPAIIGIVVGMIAVLTAILVTSPIIPQMFDPGAISLLLSKPVSRTLLLLAKFFGGCAFIFLNVTYLLGGLWLIVGWRWHIWNHGLLLCIPVFLFLFAIYYSVSALAGLIWKSAIVSVVLTIAFWLACTTVGAAKNTIESIFFDAQRITRLVHAGDRWIGVRESFETVEWNEHQSQWQNVFQRRGRGPQLMIGPLYDEKNDRLIGAFGGGRRGFAEMFGRRSKLFYGPRNEGWNPNEGPDLPAGTFNLLMMPGGPLYAVSDRGLFRFAETAAKPTNGLFNMLLGSPVPFRQVSPEDLQLQQPAAAAIDRSTGEVAVFSRGQLTLLSPDDEGRRFVRSASFQLEGDEDQAALVAIAGGKIAVARAESGITLIDTATADQQVELPMETRSQPRFVTASPDGQQFAILFHNRKLWMIDADSATARRAEVAGQGDISAVSFDEDGGLVVVDRVARLSRYAAQANQLEERFGPPQSNLELVYRFAILPLYTVFPKPGELDQTVQYVLNRRSTIDFGMAMNDLQERQIAIDPWEPVWSSLAFMVVMLTIACIYIERQEF